MIEIMQDSSFYRAKILYQPGLEIAQGHQGHGRGCLSLGLHAPESFEVSRYSLALNGLGPFAWWPWNVCPSKFLIRALLAATNHNNSSRELEVEATYRLKLIMMFYKTDNNKEDTSYYYYNKETLTLSILWKEDVKTLRIIAHCLIYDVKKWI